MYALLPALSLGFVGANVASAHWMGGAGPNVTPEEIATRQASMFQETATLLGISVDAVKEGWAAGKTITEMATENGITEEALKIKMEAARKAKLAAQLKTLVDQGIITQAQADKRLLAVGAKKGKGGRGHRGGGFHHDEF